jgi:hypothetical protein
MQPESSETRSSVAAQEVCELREAFLGPRRSLRLTESHPPSQDMDFENTPWVFNLLWVRVRA